MSTRNLPEGEVLYTGIKDIHINRNDQSPMGEKALAEVDAAISIGIRGRSTGMVVTSSLTASACMVWLAT